MVQRCADNGGIGGNPWRGVRTCVQTPRSNAMLWATSFVAVNRGAGRGSPTCQICFGIIVEDVGEAQNLGHRIARITRYTCDFQVDAGARLDVDDRKFHDAPYSKRGRVFALHQVVEGIESGALIGEEPKHVPVAVAALVTGSTAIEDVSEENPAVVD